MIQKVYSLFHIFALLCKSIHKVYKPLFHLLGAYAVLLYATQQLVSEPSGFFLNNLFKQFI